jgi:hypothetical protein
MDRDRGGAMKIRIWLATRERETWIAAVEILGVTAVLWTASESTVLRVVGFLLVAHLGYTAMTGLPMGRIPGRPPGRQPRRNLDLRAQVAWFLREVRRVDEYAQRARVAGWAPAQLEESLRSGEQRVMAAASRVAKAATRGSARPAGSSARSTRQVGRPGGLNGPARPKAGPSG